MTNKADRPFSEVAATPENANWEKLIARPSALLLLATQNPKNAKIRNNTKLA